MTAPAVPTADVAMRLAERAFGRKARSAERFVTGMMHYVFEVELADRLRVVVRANTANRRAIVRDAALLSKQLRPVGVPLPAILAEDLDGPFPHLILERLPGSDLGRIIDTLPRPKLESIAERIAAMQAIVAQLASAGRYGYAATPAAAWHGCWSEVLDQLLARSARRIAAAGLFGAGPVEAVASLIRRERGILDALPATPFLHDTTTKNVIVTARGELSGIVDVDDLCFGDPRFTPALTLASLIASSDSTFYVEAWMRAAGYADDRIFRLYVAHNLVGFMAEHGQTFNGNPLPSNIGDRNHLLAQFNETLQRAQR